MGRILGIDFGTKRVGLAVSDPSWKIATPLEVLHRRDTAQDGRKLLHIVRENDVERIVIGLPVHLRGHESTSAGLARRFGGWLAGLTGLSVVFVDERFTTSEAEDSLIEAGLKASKRKDLRDMLAARILLQNYLDDGCPMTSAALDSIEDRPQPREGE